MVTPKRLFNSLAVGTTSPGSAVYTAPQYTRCVRPYVTFLNTSTTTADTITVAIVRNGEAVALDAAELVWKTRTLAPLESKICHELATQILEPGDSLYFVSVNGTITVHGSAAEITINS
jgi:hypothetical protein